MRKILIAVLFVLSFSDAFSQAGMQRPVTRGYRLRNVIIDSFFALPADTFTVPTDIRTFPFIARKGTTLYIWNTSTFVWSAVSGGSTPTWQQTLTAGSTLTGNNTITGGGFNFVWNNSGAITFDGDDSDPLIIDDYSNVTINAGTAPGNEIVFNNSGTLDISANNGNLNLISASDIYLKSGVYGSAIANGDLILNGTSHATKTTSYVNLQTGGGNVGIGTSTPTSLLHVGGSGQSLTIGEGAVANKLLFMEPSGSGSGYISFEAGVMSGALTQYTLPVGYPAVSGYALTSTTGGVMSWAAGGGGLTVGTTAITSGTATRLLFEGTGNVLQEDDDLVWDATNKRMTVYASNSGGDIKIGEQSAGFGGIWFGQTSPSNSNYGFLGSTNLTAFNVNGGGTGVMDFRYGNTTMAKMTTYTWSFGFASSPVASQSVTIFPANNSYVGLDVRGVASQAANIFQTTNSSGAVLQATSKDGHFIHSARQQEKQGADVASAAGAIALGADGNTFEITGTNSITLISNVNWQNGSVIILGFTSTATLTDGTANSGTDIGMELAGNVNFTGSAGATLTLVLMEIGGTQRWRETARSVN